MGDYEHTAHSLKFHLRLQHRIKLRKLMSARSSNPTKIMNPLEIFKYPTADINPEVQFWHKKADMLIFKQLYAITNMIIDLFFFFIYINSQTLSQVPYLNNQNTYLGYVVTSTVNTLFVI